MAASAQYPQTLLIEEFTGERCPNCPPAATALHAYLEAQTPEQAARTSVICHHVGFYDDWLTCASSKPLTWYYNDGGSTYAPAMMVNRTHIDSSEPGAAMGMGRTAASLAKWYDPVFEGSSNYQLANTVKYSAEEKTLAVHVVLTRAAAANAPRLTLYLTEDNIKAKSQSGASNFVHQHALRASNTANWGAKVANADWKDNVYEYDYTFKVDDEWKPEDLKVVSICNFYVSTNMDKSVVYASKTTPYGEFEMAGINDVVSDAEDADAPVEYFSLQGQRVAQPAAGQVVIRRQGRKASKVIL